MAQEPVTNLIRTEAQKQGVNPDLAIQIASVESGLNPQAQNPKSSASGLFQLIDRTRKQLGGDPKNKFDPLENVRLGVKLIKQNEGQLMTSLGRRPTDHELYMAHLFGPTGAVSLIQADPNIPVQKAVLGFSSPKTADAIVKNNRLTGTVGDVIGKFQQKFGGKPQTQQKTAPAKQKPAAPEGPVPFTTGFDFADLGPSYQAAFALASLGMLEAPTEGEEQKKKKVEVEEEPQQPSRSSQMLAGMKLPEPLAFAEGGSAEKAPAVAVTPEEKPKTEAKSMLDKLLEARKEATSTLPGMGADIAASTINPVYGAVAGAADFETARREGDLLGMGLAGIGLVPVFGGMVRGGGKLLQRIGKEGAGGGGKLFQRIGKEGAESGAARIMPQREYTPETPFFSRLETGLMDIAQNKASKEQWSGMIRNMPGVPKAEKDYLIEALQGIESKGPLTKDQVLEAFQPISARRFTGEGVRKGTASALYPDVDNPFYAGNGFFKKNKGVEMFLGSLKYTRGGGTSEDKTFDEIASVVRLDTPYGREYIAKKFLRGLEGAADDAGFIFRDFDQRELESRSMALFRQFDLFTPRVGSGTALDRIRSSIIPASEKLNNIILEKAGLDLKEGERLYGELMRLHNLNLDAFKPSTADMYFVEMDKFLQANGVTSASLQKLAEDLKTFTAKKAKFAKPLIAAKQPLYESKHFSLPNSVLFSRMTPAEALNPATGGKENALYVHEIQPDWLKSRIEKGSPSDKAKDTEELSRLENEFDRIARQPADGGRAYSLRDEELFRISKKINKIEERVATNAYDISNLPGPLTDPRNAALVQQAGVKNAINIALQEGKDMVVFPIPDIIGSASARKYYNFEKGGPLRQSLEDTTKQLGKGFEVTQVKLPEAANEFADRLFPAIRILPEGRERIMRELKGIPFKDGGLVDKALSDNRKFV